MPKDHEVFTAVLFPGVAAMPKDHEVLTAVSIGKSPSALM